MVNGEGAPGAGAAGAEPTTKELMAEMAKLSEAMKAKDAQYDALKETYERTNALVQTMMENGGRGAGGAGGGAGTGGGRGGELILSRDYSSEFQIPNEAVQAIVQETLKVAESKFDSRFMSMQQVAKARDTFYKENPDLVGSEFLVGSISQQVDMELPNKTVAEKFKEVASRARTYIKRYQDAHSAGDDDTPPAAGGTASHEGAGAGGGGGEGEKPLTPDAELSAEVAERNKLRSARSRLR